MSQQRSQANTDFILPYIDIYDNHPVAKQQFANFFRVFRSPTATEFVVSSMVHHILTTHPPDSIAAVICPEAEGFILGSLVASRLQLPIIPVRKKGKLPGDVVRQKYGKWSGGDEMEMQRCAFDGIEMKGKGVIVVDDSIASGGSVGAVIDILKKMDIEVVEGLFIMETIVEEFREKQKKACGDLRIWGCFQLTQEMWDGMLILDGKGGEDGEKVSSTD